MGELRRVERGQAVKAADINQIVDEVKRLGKVRVSSGLGYRSTASGQEFWLAGTDDWFWGVIVSDGNCSDPVEDGTGSGDFDDNRYWIKAAYPNIGAYCDVVEFVIYDTDNPNYRHVCATNLGEAESGTHTLQPGMVVQVFYEYDDGSPATVRYSFSRPTGLNVSVYDCDYGSYTTVAGVSDLKFGGPDQASGTDHDIGYVHPEITVSSHGPTPTFVYYGHVWQLTVSGYGGSVFPVSKIDCDNSGYGDDAIKLAIEDGGSDGAGFINSTGHVAKLTATLKHPDNLRLQTHWDSTTTGDELGSQSPTKILYFKDREDDTPTGTRGVEWTVSKDTDTGKVTIEGSVNNSVNTVWDVANPGDQLGSQNPTETIYFRKTVNAQPKIGVTWTVTATPAANKATVEANIQAGLGDLSDVDLSAASAQFDPAIHTNVIALNSNTGKWQKLSKNEASLVTSVSYASANMTLSQISSTMKGFFSMGTPGTSPITTLAPGNLPSPSTVGTVLQCTAAGVWSIQELTLVA